VDIRFSEDVSRMLFIAISRYTWSFAAAVQISGPETFGEEVSGDRF